MDKAARDVERKSSQPEQKQYADNGPDHVNLLLIACVRYNLIGCGSFR